MECAQLFMVLPQPEQEKCPSGPWASGPVDNVQRIESTKTESEFLHPNANELTTRSFVSPFCPLRFRFLPNFQFWARVRASSFDTPLNSFRQSVALVLQMRAWLMVSLRPTSARRQGDQTNHNPEPTPNVH